MRKFAAVCLVVLALAFSGCASANKVTEGDRQLSHQNIGAAAAILGAATAPAIVVPAGDIKANSEQQLENWGLPESPQAYSPKASAASREQAKGEHAQAWYMAIGAGILGIGLPVLINRFAPSLGTFASNILGGIFKGKATKTAEATMAGVEQYMRANPNISAILTGYLTRAQEKLGVRSFAGGLLGQVKTSILPQLPTGAPGVVAPVGGAAPVADAAGRPLA